MIGRVDSWPAARLRLDRLAQCLPVAALGVRCSRTADIARIARSTGHHAIWIDMEHSTMPVDTAAMICAASVDLGLVPFVRRPERDYGVIGRLLDGGATGIIGPRIETAEQARDLVAACKFPPYGHRSAISTLSLVEFKAIPAGEFNDLMNSATIVKVLIESPLGVENIESIAAVPGVDLIGIGTNDLTAEMGVPGEYRHVDVRHAHEAALAACRALGKPLAIGGIGDPDYAAELIRTWCRPIPFYRHRYRSSLGRRTRSHPAGAGIHWRLIPPGDIASMTADVLVPKPMRGAQTLTSPAFRLPAGACDSHVHVFGPESRYARVDRPHYTLPDGNLPQLQLMAQALNLQRFVIVQPSYYGTDNSCMLDALAAAGPRARGVAMVDERVSDSELEAMHVRGVRALRLDLFLRSSFPTSELIAYIERSVRRTRAFGWHVQFYTPGWVIRDLLPFLFRAGRGFRGRSHGLHVGKRRTHPP